MSPVANGLLCQGQPESEMMQNVTVAQDCTPAHHLSLLIMWIECAHEEVGEAGGDEELAGESSRLVIYSSEC